MQSECMRNMSLHVCVCVCVWRTVHGTNPACMSLMVVCCHVSLSMQPPLPLDCDHTAPPLRDHKLSQPTLDDIGYLLRRWGTRWASEREDILHKRHERGVAIPHGLSPRTMDRVLHSEHSVWEKEFERSTEDARQFGWPASGPHSLAGAAGALTARLRQQ